jgi:hypothetical protein
VGGVLTGAAAILGVALVVSSGKDDGGGGGTPEAAAEDFMEAAKRGDTAAVEAGLCQEDLTNDVASSLSETQLESYTLGTVEQQQDGVTVVNTEIKVAGDDDPSDGKLPMVDEGGGWKVCFSRMFDVIDEPTSEL